MTCPTCNGEKYSGDFPIEWTWTHLAAVLWFALFWLTNLPVWDESAYAAPLYGWLTALVSPLVLHFAVAVGGVHAFLRVFKVKDSPWLWLAIAPYVWIASMQSSASLPPFLFLVSLWVGGGLCTALMCLARTEWLVLAILGRWKTVGVAFAIVVLFLSTGTVISPNSPAVFYISLGQLPNNAWGIEYSDAEAWRKSSFAPWERPALFREAAADSILARPLEYAKKCAHNLWRVLGDGVEVGILGNYGKVIYGGVMWLSLALWWVKRESTPVSREVIAVLALVVLMQMLGQQMARHTNIIYLPILGIAWAKTQQTKRED
jgi:hypothetical protein